MRIFISYPREHEESAKIIYWTLQNRGLLNVFLDSETLHVGDAWKVAIETQIRKANVLIILYDHGAASDKSRYFCTELGHHIKEECKNNEKFIITVLFSPETLKENNLPIYLKGRQVIASPAEEIDHGSIDSVIQRVQGLEAERQNKKRKYTLVGSLLVAAMVILVVILIVPPRPIRHDSHPDHQATQNIAKKTCEELLTGKQYDFWGSYTLIEEDGIRATSEAGTWKLKSCEESSAPKGRYILNGEEETTQRVEVEINGKYYHVAQAQNDSRSKLTIDKDGRLVDRQIYYDSEGPFNGRPKIVPRKNEQVWKRYEGDIWKKLDKYEVRLEDLHLKAAKNMHCIPTRGRREDNREIIAFTCVIDPSSSDRPKYYTRVMMKGIDRS